MQRTAVLFPRLPEETLEDAQEVLRWTRGYDFCCVALRQYQALAVCFVIGPVSSRCVGSGIPILVGVMIDSFLPLSIQNCRIVMQVIIYLLLVKFVLAVVLFHIINVKWGLCCTRRIRYEHTFPPTALLFQTFGLNKSQCFLALYIAYKWVSLQNRVKRVRSVSIGGNDGGDFSCASFPQTKIEFFRHGPAKGAFFKPSGETLQLFFD